MTPGSRGIAAALVVLAVAAHPAPAQAPADATEDEAAVWNVLDTLHDAASKADFDRYFGVYSDDAIFLGTDATERWTRDEFIAYAKPYFDQGRGWTYTMTERHVYVSDDGATAWFDERLDNEFLGECRGTGALVKVGGAWKVAQYNLTLPIPNALAGEFAERIRTHEAAD